MNIDSLSISGMKKFASLDKRKYRIEHGLFAVEGKKAFFEILSTGKYTLKAIIALSSWWEHVSVETYHACERYAVTSKELSRLSSLVSPPEVIGYFELPQEARLNVDCLKGNLTIALDGVQDPGNVGTIIRLADWWGVKNIICSSNTADCYSPKVVQASMGSLGRVSVFRYDSLDAILRESVSGGLKVYGTFMDGENLFKSHLDKSGILLMGSEGKGISENLMPYISNRLTIPPFPMDSQHVESLNVATATAILLAQFRYGKG